MDASSLIRALPRRGLHRPPGTLRALATAALDPGDRVARFEEEAARALGARHAVATGSGRAALAMALRCLDLEAGDEVLVPALTFGAVPETIRAEGLRPVFADVDPDTLQMDPRLAEARAGPRARVLLATHLMGLMCDLPALEEVCQRRGLVMIEDFAQAAGATLEGRPAGSWGRAGFTSLETVKPLAAFGGGLLVTADGELARGVRTLSSRLPDPDPARLVKKVAMGQLEALLSHPLGFGLLGRPLFLLAGGAEGVVAHYKRRKGQAKSLQAGLHPAQAEVGRLGLRSLGSHLARRRENVRLLRCFLPGAWTPRVAAGCEPSWYQLVARTRDPVACARACLRQGVDVGTGVVTDLSGGACPRAALAAREAIQLPCHPGLTQDDLRRVARVVGPWLDSE